MPLKFFLMPLTALEHSVGAAFPHSDLSLIQFQSIFASTYATASESPVPIITPAIVERHLLPSFTSPSVKVHYKNLDFHLVEVTPSLKTPGALIITGTDSKQYHLQYNKLPIIDWRTFHRTVSDAHDSGRRHRSAKSTLNTLQSTFALLPTFYVSLILSLCHCAHDKPANPSRRRRRRRHDEEDTDIPNSKRVCMKSSASTSSDAPISKPSKQRRTHLRGISNTSVQTNIVSSSSTFSFALESPQPALFRDDKVCWFLNDLSPRNRKRFLMRTHSVFDIVSPPTKHLWLRRTDSGWRRLIFSVDRPAMGRDWSSQ